MFKIFKWLSSRLKHKHHLQEIEVMALYWSYFGPVSWYWVKGGK